MHWNMHFALFDGDLCGWSNHLPNILNHPIPQFSLYLLQFLHIGHVMLKLLQSFGKYRNLKVDDPPISKHKNGLTMVRDLQAITQNLD